MSNRRQLGSYPVNLQLSGRKVLVVGAGRIAVRKIEGLLFEGANVTVVAPDASEEIETLSSQARLQYIQREYKSGDTDGFQLVLTATDQHEVNAAVFQECEQNRVWCNSADDPSNCSFTLMSVVRQSDITIAIGTAGRSPALTKWLRKKTEKDIGPEFAVLLDLLSERREQIQLSGRSSEDADWETVITDELLSQIRAGDLDTARSKLAEL